ncbi:F-box/FBD/LRR-repeat protein At1g13570-like [Helianthus annuus]|nr:F-box/FBD/LRR-repeat protein At1g13570-like [Helianthus annuus]
MELIHGTHKASKSARQDFISNMPDNMVTNILDRLALRDAVRTSILSRNWRILLHLRGAITKFFLSIDEVIDDEDVNHWILLLSRKGIKELTIRNWHEPPLKLHTHLFSCLELKHLTLSNCYFNPPPTFHGFPNLLSLKLVVLFEENNNLGALFTGSPLLESLAVNDRRGLGKVKLVEFAKLENLKILFLILHGPDFEMIKSSGTILGSLSKLQELHLNFKDCRLTEGDANKRFSTSIFGLKYLRLTRICLDDGMKLSCALDLIRSFPNLQTLIIVALMRRPNICLMITVRGFQE